MRSHSGSVFGFTQYLQAVFLYARIDFFTLQQILYDILVYLVKYLSLLEMTDRLIAETEQHIFENSPGFFVVVQQQELYVTANLMQDRGRDGNLIALHGKNKVNFSSQAVLAFYAEFAAHQFDQVF